MNETANIGPFLIQWGLLAWIVAGAAGYAAMRLMLRGERFAGRIAEMMLNAVLFLLIAWKFGGIVQEPQLLWRDPLEVLLAGGSQTGLLFGILIVVIYLAMMIRHFHLPVLLVLDMLPFGVFPALAVKSLFYWQYGLQTALPWGITLQASGLRYHPINVYVLVLSSALFIWFVYKHKNRLGKGRSAEDFFLYTGIGFLLISFFDVRHSLLGFFSVQQWLDLAMIACGFGLQLLFKKTDDV